MPLPLLSVLCEAVFENLGLVRKFILNKVYWTVVESTSQQWCTVIAYNSHILQGFDQQKQTNKKFQINYYQWDTRTKSYWTWFLKAIPRKQIWILKTKKEHNTLNIEFKGFGSPVLISGKQLAESSLIPLVEGNFTVD